MEQPAFVIESTEVEAMAKNSGQTVPQLLASLVKPAQSLARPPISNFHVASVGLGSSGRIFIGVNLEFPGLPLNYSVHSEQFLITNLNLNAESELQYFAVSAAPCGHCRQFFQEIRNAPDIKIQITSNETNQFDSLSDFLPQRFGPNDLLEKDVPLLLEPHDNRLTIVDKDDTVSGGGYDGELKRSALIAANTSHAPYSGCPSGVALVDSEGKIYKGAYMESAAYNPSLGPIQAALVDYVANGGGGGYELIVKAVLVEKEEAVVKQEDTVRLLLQLISPKCEFKVFRCCSSSN